MLLLVGLGNPNPNNTNNRHNVGFLVIDLLMKNLNYQSKNQNLKVC